LNVGRERHKSPGLLSSAIKDFLDGLRSPFASQVNDGNVRTSINGDGVFSNPIANAMVDKEPLDFFDLAERQPDVWSGRAFCRDMQGFLSGGIGHRLFLFELVRCIIGDWIMPAKIIQSEIGSAHRFWIRTKSEES
jgi:hypothetical protein